MLKFKNPVVMYLVNALIIGFVLLFFRFVLGIKISDKISATIFLLYQIYFFIIRAKIKENKEKKEQIEK